MAELPFDYAGERYASLATFRRDGREVRTPIWFAPVGTILYAFSAGDAGKVKRIRRDGRARVAACTLRGAITSPWHDAHARIVTEAAEVAAAYMALRTKYGWTMRVTDFFARLSGRYARRAILAIDTARPARE